MTSEQETESDSSREYERSTFDSGIVGRRRRGLERLRRGIDAPRLRIRPAAVVVAVLVVAGLGLIGPVGAETDATDKRSGERSLMSQNDQTVTIGVDCNRSRVELTAPEGYRYDVSVAVANVTPTANDVSRTTRGSVEGNTTVDLDAEGFVFILAESRSGDEVTDVTDCTDAGSANTTDQANETDPTVDIDCEESAVRFAASEGAEYVAKVTTVDVSSTGTSTSSTTQTLAGNATVSVEEGGLVAVFASSGELGDDRTVSEIRNCSSWGTEENETESG